MKPREEAKAFMVGSDGKRREIDIKLSPEAQKEMDDIDTEVRKDLKPMYDKLGVDIDTEELHWTNGEVFVIDKETRKRRELKGTQQELNDNMLSDAINLAKKVKGEK